MANLSSLGNFLANDPQWIRSMAMLAGEDPQEAMYKATENAMRNAALEDAAAQRSIEAARRNKLAQSGGQITNELIQDMYQIDPDYAMKLVAAQAASAAPANVREYEYFNSLSPQDQKRYLVMKRSSQIMNLGGTQAVYDPLAQGKGSEFNVTPKPEQMPEFKGQQEESKQIGKSRGEAGALLESSVAKLPELFQKVQYLSDLGKKATYTEAGKAKDWLARQAGISTEGATARTEYMSVVDNQILPLLRDTFGAQFTENEGKTLRSTLGDPDKTPEQKDAVLQSFINQKIASVQSLERQTGNPVSDISAPSIGGDTIDNLAPDEIEFLKSQGLLK